MKKFFFLFTQFFFFFNFSSTQNVWTIKASAINPSNYFGETVANGMIGIVSSPDPFKVKDVVPKSRQKVLHS